MSKKTMFKEKPKSAKLAKIVTIENPTKARHASATLKREFRNARSRDKKTHIKRSAVLAANRAEAMTRKKDLSPKERKELKEISGIYRNAAKSMRLQPKRRR